MRARQYYSNCLVAPPLPALSMAPAHTRAFDPRESPAQLGYPPGTGLTIHDQGHVGTYNVPGEGTA